MNGKKRIVIIGATSAIAEQCARLWAAEMPAEMILVGRNLQKLEQVASDLRVRAPSSLIRTIATDFHDPLKIQALADEIGKEQPIDIALIAHGSLPDQQRCQRDLLENKQTLLINGVSCVLFAEAFVANMQKIDRGTLVVIGSVAGDRGRKSNYVYGAAKGLVTRYVQGLQHRFARTRVKVILVKPGPTDTPMTAHLKEQGLKMATAESVARCITQGIEKGKDVIYAPPKWKLIMLIVRHLPSCVFNRTNL